MGRAIPFLKSSAILVVRCSCLTDVGWILNIVVALPFCPLSFQEEEARELNTSSLDELLKAWAWFL